VPQGNQVGKEIVSGKSSITGTKAFKAFWQAFKWVLF
jgi:hypothetical protein